MKTLNTHREKHGGLKHKHPSGYTGLMEESE